MIAEATIEKAELPGVSDDLTMAQAHRRLAGILLLALLLRIGVCWFFQGVGLQVWDERDYNQIAVNLATSGEFAFEPGQPISLRPPLYPAMLAAVYSVAGVENYPAVRIVQVGLGLALVCLCYMLGCELLTRRTGLWAASLSAFYPSLVIYTGFLLTELQFATLLAAGCLAAVRSFRNQSFSWLALSGVLLALGALTRSALWPFPIVMVPFLVATWPGSLTRRMAAAVVFCLAFVSVLTPWAVRNTRLQQALTIVDCMGGRNLMMGNYEYTPTFRAWSAIEEQGERAWFNVLKRADPLARNVTQGQLDKRAMRYAAHYMAAHPIQTAQRDLVKFFNFWGLEREILAGVTRGFYGTFSSVALLGLTATLLGSYALAILFGVYGCVVAPPIQWRSRAFLVLMIAVICGAHTLTFGHSRYHLPVMPLVLVFASIAIVEWSVIRLSFRSPRFALASLLAAIFVSAWCLEVLLIYRENVSELLQALS